MITRLRSLYLECVSRRTPDGNGTWPNASSTLSG
jgi:hypothetical protein